MEERERYASVIFLNAVIPLLKVVIEEDEKLSAKGLKCTGVVQIGTLSENGKLATHLVFENGEIKVVKGVHEQPTIELCFKRVEDFNGFFRGTSKKLPSIKGLRHFTLLTTVVSALLRMSKLLGSKEAPAVARDKALLVRLYFYLLSSGISQLNKAGHPIIASWVKKSPDRVYAWTVNQQEDMSAYIRIKAGNSKAARGLYKRSKPFFTMRFDSPDSALGILMEKDDMFDSTAKGKLMMEGAPEFGAQLGDYMAIVGSFLK